MLTLSNVNSHYGEARILQDFSLEARAGEVLCLLGRNGAGKTTALKTIMGLVSVSSGTIMLDDTDLAKLPAYQIPKCGVGYVPQGRRLFSDLDVAANLEIGRRARRGISDQTEKVLTLFPVLKERMRQKAGTLSGGEQQMLATARALSLDPRVLLMDEPTEGLQPSMIDKIREVVITLRSSGVAIIIVEQRVDAVLPVADRVAFIENGQNRDTVGVQALRDDPSLINRYVGVGTDKVQQ